MKFNVKTLALCVALSAPLGAMAFGAIAVEDEEGQTEPGYGLVTRADSRESAGRAALAMCTKSGNDNCKVIARFDKCGAYASSSQRYGAGWGLTESAAKEMAMEKCDEQACRVRVSECE